MSDFSLAAALVASMEQHDPYFEQDIVARAEDEPAQMKRMWQRAADELEEASRLQQVLAPSAEEIRNPNQPWYARYEKRCNRKHQFKQHKK